MIYRFLNAKHWQLFSLMFGIPFLFQIIMMGTFFSTLFTVNNSDSEGIFNFFAFIPIIMILLMGMFFGWLWSIAIGLQHKIPKGINLKTNRFKLFLFIPILYLSAISLFISSVIIGFDPGKVAMGGLVAVIFPLHLLSMFGIFHSMYFAAKTLKTVELQREVNFGDFAGEFFLLWFYFVGIWILQPRINNISKNKITENSLE